MYFIVQNMTGIVISGVLNIPPKFFSLKKTSGSVIDYGGINIAFFIVHSLVE